MFNINFLMLNTNFVIAHKKYSDKFIRIYLNIYGIVACHKIKIIVCRSYCSIDSNIRSSRFLILTGVTLLSKSKAK